MEFIGKIFYSFGYGGVEKILLNGNQVTVRNEISIPTDHLEHVEYDLEEQKELYPFQQ